MSYVERGKAEVIYNKPIDDFVFRQDLKTSLVSFKKNGIDATALASTLIGKTDAGDQLFYPTEVFVIAELITAHTSVASLSVGTNSTDYNDILAITAQTNLGATGKKLLTPLTANNLSRLAASTDIYVKITTAAVGTVETYTVIVRGFYEKVADAINTLR